MSEAFSDYLRHYQHRANDQLRTRLGEFQPSSPPLGEAMAYGLLSPGKRLRPVLVYSAAETVGEINATADAVACAVECLHSYSLIHDDLPAMDDDDLRRGQPTCHVAFGEAAAILAGDALQTLAFEWLSEANSSAALCLQLIRELSKAAGHHGMVGGQMRDLNAASEAVNLSELEDLHRRKTGALIRASTIMGGIAGGSDNDTELDALGNYASALGLAFQIHDDILDVEAPTETLGKTQGADARLNKPTYVTIAGLDRAKALAKQQVDAAIAALDNFGQRASRLHQLAHYIVERHY